MQKAFYIIIKYFLAGWVFCISAQGQIALDGRVIDRETGEHLPFVNIVYNEKGTGTTTNLDGYFSIRTEVIPEFLRLSYVGYETETVHTPEWEQAEILVLTMKRRPYLIEEVTVSPGINPAHRIIENAFRNRRLNDPEMLSSFSYTSYNKLFFTLVPDSVLSRVNLPGSPGVSIRFAFTGAEETGNRQSDDTDTLRHHENAALNPPENDTLAVEITDSSEIRMREFLEKQHLFLMESVSKREYRRPGRNNEKVLASRVSGFRDPSFSLLATQLQSFSFYDDFISLLDRRYLNPISRGSTSRYSFILEDSMFTERNDTLFVISFRPYPVRNFDGLRGVVYINSNGYAVQNVIAEPFEPAGFFTIRIQQNYSFVDDRQWFPAELNTDIIMGRESGSAQSPAKYSLVGIGKSYLSDIEIEPGLARRRFNHVELTISPDAHRQDESFWQRYRIEPLSSQDEATYHFMDSIGEEANFDRTLRIFEALATGYVPWGYMNIDYSSLLDYNRFEGVRPGLRMLTNERVSDIFWLGGHIAWGGGDRKVKYGGEAGLTLYRPGDINLGISFSKDVEEAGTHSFLNSDSPLSSENYRRFIIDRMDYVEKYTASLSMRLMRHFTGRLYMSNSGVTPGDDYLFLENDGEKNLFRFSEAGLQVRFAFREKFMQTPKGNRISMGTDFPIVWINYGLGSHFLEGEYDYTRVEAGLLQTFTTKSLGKTSVMVEGGRVRGDVPFQKLYNSRSSYRNFFLEAANSFATMRMTEFISDEFVAVYFRQNFGSLLFRSGNFRPELVFVTNAAFGRLSKPENHLNIPVRSLDKGYYESGLLLNNLYRQFFTGYGIGVFYRYGPYSFNKAIDNFSFKFTFNINLR